MHSEDALLFGECQVARMAISSWIRMHFKVERILSSMLSPLQHAYFASMHLALHGILAPLPHQFQPTASAVDSMAAIQAWYTTYYPQYTGILLIITRALYAASWLSTLCKFVKLNTQNVVRP
jgi:hypothetical protein